MEKFIVGVDADGVLTDMAKFNLEEGRKFFKKEPVDLTGYSAREIYGGTKKQEFIFGLKVLDKYCKETPLRIGAKDVLDKLHEEGVELHEITARKFATFKNVLGSHYRRLFEKYLKKHELYFDSIQYCSETDSPTDKLLACSKLDVDVMLEDKPEVALHLANNGIKVLFFDAPYNQEVKHPNITRVYTWDECYEIIEQMKKEKQEISEYKYLNKEERSNLNKEEQIEYIKSYKKYIKNLKVNKVALAKSEKRFKLLYYVTVLPFSLMFKSKIKGKENIPYQNGFIIASNHLNSYDQFYISRALGCRQFVGFAASTIKDTIRGRMFDYTGGAVFIDRKDSESKARGEEELNKQIVEGKVALIFPEGTRKNAYEENKDKLQLPFKLGTVSMAQKTCTGILPVSLYHGKKSYLKIGKMQFVSKDANLIEANEKLEKTIADMTIESMNEDKKHCKKKTLTK